MELQVGVKILLKNREGKYLLVKKNPQKYPEVGAKWDIVGGRIIPGAPLIDNLCREIKEEVGLVYQDQPKLVAAQDIFKLAEAHIVRLTYIGEIEGEPKIDDDHLEAKWFLPQEIQDMDKSILDRYFAQLINEKIIKLK